MKWQVSDPFSIQSRSVEKIMDECNGINLMIFTDGAMCGGSVDRVHVQLFSSHLQE